MRVRILPLLLIAACSVAPVEIAGLACPCPEPEYTCACVGDPDERCVLATDQPMCSSGVDAGNVDAGNEDTETPDVPASTTCDGLFRIEGLQRDWSTETVIAIEWTVVTREADLFDRYVIEVSSEAATSIVDRNTNPELGEYDLDLNGTVVERTWLRNLTQNTTYDVTLTAVDRNGGECQLSASFSTRPEERLGEWVFFTDTARRIRPAPDCTTIRPGDGDPYVELEILCERQADGEVKSYCDSREPFEVVDSCFTNLLLFPEPEPIPAGLRAQFDEAFVEFRLRATGEGVVSSDWSINLIRTQRQQAQFDSDPSDPNNNVSWAMLGFTVPINQGFQTFQVPLSEYTHIITGEPMTADDLDVFEWFLVGGTWPNGMRLDVDEVRIRW